MIDQNEKRTSSYRSIRCGSTRASARSNRSLAIGCALMAIALFGVEVGASQQETEEPQVTRTLYVPFDDLHVLLKGQTERVFLTREEYDELKKTAKQSPQRLAPRGFALTSSQYQGEIRQGEAQLTGTIELEILNPGFHEVPLDMQGVTLLGAKLDGEGAPLIQDPNGTVRLLVEGLGKHELEVELSVPVSVAAAQQSMQLHLPYASAGRLKLDVPGNVEVKSGADVVNRVYDEAGNSTTFELLPSRTAMSLVMSLNNKTLRDDQLVTSRSVVVSEITTAYERVHATIAYDVLQGIVEQVTFRIPSGFQVTQVDTELLDQWQVTSDDGTHQEISVTLRETTREPLIVRTTAIRTPSRLDDWSMPEVEALNVSGSVSVLGIVAETRLTPSQIESSGLLPLDTDVLIDALPDSVLEAESGAPEIQPVAAFYAPGSTYELSAALSEPKSGLAVVTHLLLTVADQGLDVDGGFVFSPSSDKLRSFDFQVPLDWRVDQVSLLGGQILASERINESDHARIHVKLPVSVEPGANQPLFFHARHVPETWLNDWDAQAIPFPAFEPVGAATEQGAIAIRLLDDLQVESVVPNGLTPLDSSAREEYGLSQTADDIAYRFTDPDYELQLGISRAEPFLTSRNYSFLSLGDGVLRAHYEVVFNVDRARVREVQLNLPSSTPQTLAFRGGGGVEVKESSLEVDGDLHRWTVRLAQPMMGSFRLITDFEQNLETRETNVFELPLIRAEDVAFQNEMVAIEGNAELDVELDTEMRRVDVGELSEAEYLPGSQLLGAFDAVEEAAQVTVTTSPRLLSGLPPAIVQRAELVTMVAASGRNQTAARYLLRTKVSFVEIELPELASLWAVMLDGKPVKPQRRGQAILLTLQTQEQNDLRDLQVVYESPIQSVDLLGRIDADAPRLLLKDGVDEVGREVPQADLVWHLYLPKGYDVSRVHGNVFRTDPSEVRSPIARLALAADNLGGGVRRGWLEPAATMVADSTRSAMPQSAFESETSEDRYLEDSELYLSDDSDYVEDESGAAPSSQRFSRRGSELGMPAPSNSPTTDNFSVPNQSPGESSQSGNGGQPSAPNESGGGGGGFGGGNFGGGGGQDQGQGQSRGFGDEGQAGDGGEAPGGRDLNRPGSSGSDRPTAGAAGPASGAPGNRPNTSPQQPRDSEEGSGAQDSTLNQQPEDTIGKFWAMQGLGSLAIELSADGEAIEFSSVGNRPVLDATIVHRERISSLSWGVAIAIFVAGLLIDRLPYGVKVTYVVVAVTAALGLPLIGGPIVEFESLCDRALYSALLLIPYFIISGTLRSIAKLMQRRGSTEDQTTAGDSDESATNAGAPSAVVGMLFLATALTAFGNGRAMAQDPFGPSESVSDDSAEERPPVSVPDNALIVPYDSDDPDGQSNATQVLVPYDEYQRLWSAAYPDQPLAPQTKIGYAIAGATYTTTLADNEEDGDAITLRGSIEIEVFQDDEEVLVPLRLRNAVVTSAILDDQPARLRAIVGEVDLSKVGGNGPAPIITLGVRGRGRHVFEVEIRVALRRQGGWQFLDCHLPTGPATNLVLTVPEAETQIRIGDGNQQRAVTSEQGDEVVRVVPGADAGFRFSWRPRIDEGSVDQSLTVESRGILDIREDGLRLNWHLQFSFGREERDVFRFEVPTGFVVEAVTGTNVRGWEVLNEETQPVVDVQLLKAVRQSESLDVVLSQRSDAELTGSQRFDAPYITVAEAALHRGVIAIRRSPILEVRTLETSQVARTSSDALPADMGETLGLSESPLGQRLFQAFRFNATPFRIALESTPLDSAPSVNFESLVRIGETQASLETRFRLQNSGRGIQQLEFTIPADLDLKEVLTSGRYLWSIDASADDPTSKQLRVFLSEVRTGPMEISLKGELSDHASDAEVPIPRVVVNDVEDQEGTIVVQADPSLNVAARNLENATNVLLDQAYGWLTAEQRPLARLAIACSSSDYTGTIQLIPKQARITCDTVTNVRLTYRAIEETLLIDFRIEEAGVRELRVRLPSRFADAKVLARMVRQETRTPVDGTDEVQVSLQLQDAIIGDYRIVIEQDRSLVLGPQPAPIPVIETGETNYQYVTLQNAGRDEITIANADGFEALTRGQSQWQAMANKFGSGDFTLAHVLRDAERAQDFQYEAKRRLVVETSGARIGLAETVMIVDGGGGYRAAQRFKVDNRTEPYLEISLPETARLWTAYVAGRPVKPAIVPGGADNLVRIPLVKTAEGDLDYDVVLKYGGSLGAISNWGQVAFPLIETVNINVEQSQVRLWLPETHQWFNFDGSAVQVDDAAELDASYLAYQTRQVERLTEALRSKNSFSVTRAAGNLKQLQQVAPIANSGNESNLNWQTNYDNNSIALEQALKEVDEIEERREVIVDNRSTFNSFYEEQRSELSQNRVNRIGSNFDDQIRLDIESSKDFDQEWLSRNGLSNERVRQLIEQQQHEEDAEAQGEKAGSFRYQNDQRQQSDAIITNAEAAESLLKTREFSRRSEGDTREQFAGGRIGQQAGQAGEMEGLDLNSKYQQKLDQQNQFNPTSQLDLDFGTRLYDDDGLSLGSGGGSFGLASLDVELPERGQLFLFTTPRGDVEITARAVDQKTMNRSLNAAWLGGLLVVLSIVAWVVRKLTSESAGMAILGGLLLLVGVTSFLIGYWPWIGALMALTGSLLLMQMAIRRRANVSTIAEA